MLATSIRTLTGKKAGEDAMKEISEIDGMGGMCCGTVGPEAIPFTAMFETDDIHHFKAK